MTIQDLIERLRKILEAKPEAASDDVVVAIGDECLAIADVDYRTDSQREEWGDGYAAEIYLENV